MTEEMLKGLSLSELKKEDLNKLKKWKEEEYSKIRSDLGLILEGQKINQKALTITDTNTNDLQQDSTFRIVKTFPGFQKPGQRSIYGK